MRLVFSWLMAAILIIVIWTDGMAIEAVQYVPDEIIVKFKAGVNKANINNFNAANGVLEVATIEKIGYKVLKIPPRKSVPGMVALYNQNANVEWAEPNYIYHLLVTPNDTQYNQQWFYRSPDLVLAEDAWDVEKGDTNVIIAIVDSGVYKDHPDLDSKMWTNTDETIGDANGDGFPGVRYVDDDGDGLIDEDSGERQPGEEGYTNDLKDDDDENGYVDDTWGWDFVGNDNDPDDEHTNAHGTMVAGIAAAETNNSQGIAGAAWYCKIMAVRVADAGANANAADVAAGITYAADNGAHVINLSLGGDAPSVAVEAAINYAYGKGCVVVAAAGNEGNENPIDYPARYNETYPNVIAVGASDRATGEPGTSYDGRAYFSSWGTGEAGNPLVDVVAPGVGIYSTSKKSITGFEYKSGSGTSFSAPIVSGLAALVISRTGATDPEVVRAYIKGGAYDLGEDPDDNPDAGPHWSGSGMVKFAQTDSLPVTLSAFTVTTTQDGKVILRWTAETEVNNVGWNIYRSVNRTGPFTKLNDFVSGAGNSAFPNDYQYVDKNVVSGLPYFYYIEDIDIQGQRRKSAIVQAMPKTAVKIVPTEFQLFQNYPNPFNPATWIPYQLAEDTEVIIRIYNVAGQLIRILELGNKKAGFYLSKEKAAYWNGKNNNNDRVAGGVYFYQIKAGERLNSIRKMVLLK